MIQPGAQPRGAPQSRDPAVLLQPQRLAALQPSRLSASRSLVAQMLRERWSIRRLDWKIDAAAKGTALYRIDAGGMVFDFPVFSFEYSAKGRTGRIIGRAWDMMAALLEGPATAAEIEQTAREMPKLYAGRATDRTLVWCRSNRSSRVFNHALASLAEGRQPDIAVLAQACYLMRNTGLDGNGTFGTRTFLALEPGHPLRRSLAAQMLCAYLMRVFAIDLVEHLARCQSAKAVPLAPELNRFLGVGNGSALGLILFVNNHPKLIDRWLSAREEALVAAKSLPVTAGDARLSHLLKLLDKAITFRAQDRMHYDAFAPSAVVAEGLRKIRAAVAALHASGSAEPYSLAALCDALEPQVHAEAHETLLSLLIELVPDQADALAETLALDEEMTTRPRMRAGDLREILHRDYGWAAAMDLSAPEASRYVWYKSETAEEPRRGPREEVERAFNLGLDLPRMVQALDAALAQLPAGVSTAELLLARPDLRSFVARVQTLDGLRYHSPHMNIMGEAFVPVEIVRLLNVGLHGIDKTRDFLNRNLRGVLFHGAPLPAELAAGGDPDWFCPAEPRP